jgi:hypothetical protein
MERQAQAQPGTKEAHTAKIKEGTIVPDFEFKTASGKGLGPVALTWEVLRESGRVGVRT